MVRGEVVLVKTNLDVERGVWDAFCSLWDIPAVVRPSMESKVLSAMMYGSESDV